MSNIPPFVRSILDQLAQPGLIETRPGFLVMCAVRRKLATENDKHANSHPFRLSELQLDKLACSMSPEISTALTPEDVEYLADSFVQCYQTTRDSFAAQGFKDPVTASMTLMAQFSMKF